MQHGIQFQMSFSSSKTSLISQFNIWYFVFGNKFFADHFILFFHVTQKRSCMTSMEFLMSLPTPTLFHVLPFQEFFLVHWSTWLQPLWTRTLDCTDPLRSAEETNSRVCIRHVWLLWCFFTSLSCIIHTQSISNCSTLYEKWHARSTIWRFCGLKNRKVLLTGRLRHRNGPLILQCLFTVMSKKKRVGDDKNLCHPHAVTWAACSPRAASLSPHDLNTAAKTFSPLLRNLLPVQETDILFTLKIRLQTFLFDEFCSSFASIFSLPVHLYDTTAFNDSVSSRCRYLGLLLHYSVASTHDSLGFP